MGDFGSWVKNQVKDATDSISSNLQPVTTGVSNAARGVQNFVKDPVGSLNQFYSNPSYLTRNLDPKNLGDSVQNGFGGLQQASNDTADRKENEERTAQEAHDAAEAQRTTLLGLRDQALGQVNEYEQNLPSIQQRMNNLTAGKIRTGLTDSFSQLKRNLNSRGILGGTARDRAQDNMRSRAGSDYAAAVNDTYDKTTSDLTSMKDRVGRLGIDIAGKDQAAAEQYYQQALEDLRQKNQAYGQVGSAAGRIIGSAAARQNQYNYYDGN